MALRLLDDLDDHDLAGFCAAVCAGRNQNVLADAAVLGCHDTDAMLVEEAADHPDIRAFEHFDDMSFAPPARIDAAFARDHAVAVQHLGHFTRVQEQILAFAVSHQEAEAVGMALHPALDQIEFVDHANRVLAIAHDLAIAFHCGQTALEGFGFMRRDGKQLRHLVHRDRHALLQQDVENMLAARQWMFVTRSFALDEGITPADIRRATAGSGLAAGGFGSFFCGFHSDNRLETSPASLTKQHFFITFCALPCRDGGIGRRTRFRSWRWQHCGGSSPLLGTMSEFQNVPVSPYPTLSS